jgi:hypothetical protein
LDGVDDADIGGMALPPKEVMGLLLTGLLPKRSKTPPALVGLVLLDMLFGRGRTEAIVGV